MADQERTKGTAETSGTPPNLESKSLKVSLGQRIGNYRLTGFLGRGAFANIYLGEHCYLRTYAAVKISRRQLTGEQEERFLREAQIAAQLVHPQVLRVLEYGVERGMPYLVMDYAEYGSLREYHPIGERLEREEILGYVSDIAEALEYIHGRGYIHQDLKPENLLFGRNGQIMVSDFGIAIAVQETWGRRGQESMGTLPYMAPEQIRGQPCLASDQYALSVIVYEWICGELPFGEDPSNIIWLHLNVQPPSLRKQVPDLPMAVEQVIFRALEKDPRRRFSSIVEFVDQLALAWDEVPPPKERPSFYCQTTYNTDELEVSSEAEIPIRKEPVVESQIKGEKRGKKGWKSISGTFGLDFLLSLVVGTCVSDPDWSPLWLAMAVAIAGLPFGAGFALKDRRFLTPASVNLGLGLLSILVSRHPHPFVVVSAIGATLCTLVAFSLSMHF